jgi:hypothetical protein
MRVVHDRLQREQEAEERMQQYEEQFGIEIVDLCARRQCIRLSKRIRDTEAFVEVRCSGNCLIRYHLACWRAASQYVARV